MLSQHFLLFQQPLECTLAVGFWWYVDILIKMCHLQSGKGERENNLKTKPLFLLQHKKKNNETSILHYILAICINISNLETRIHN